MSTTTKFLLWLVLALLLAWLWFWPWYPAWQYYFCPDCYTGQDKTEEMLDQPAEDPVEVKRGALDFKWSDATAYTNDEFPAYKAALLANRTDDNILEIEGFYYEGEEAPPGFENMGLARATSILDLLSDDLPAERVQLRARLIDEVEGVRTGYFTGATFNWLEAEKTEKESVVELADRAIVRFPSNSTQRISDPAIDEYLDKLATRLQQTGETVSLTGHTDNVGPEDNNLVLGRNRAEAIRSVLLSKGVPAEKISLDSKGESQPVASNDTEAGKKENRRVEIRLIKQ